MSIKYVHAGESYKYSVGRQSNGVDIDVSDHVLQLQIKDLESGDTLISRIESSLSADNLEFIVVLSPTDTGVTLGIGRYNVCQKLSKESENYSKETDFELRISASCFS